MTDLKEIKVSNFCAQLRRNRFPDPDGTYSNSTAESIVRFADHTDNGGDTAETYSGPPHIAKWRMNLAALSQIHNLYFVASRDMLHIYAPRDLTQKLPRNPDMIIQLPRTKEGECVVGYIDPFHPHSVNHLKVGNFGDLEIVLMACDDGDIIAFYTHLIWTELAKHNVKTRIRDVRPFFLQNVGRSAWGLAIHQKSRLIAVTSNLKHLTIFVHGYSDTSKEELYDDKGSRPSSDDQSFPMVNTFAATPTSFRDQDRRYNYRIVVSFGNQGANMPSIDFINDVNGDTEEIITTDINGTTRLLQIWNSSCYQCPGMYNNPEEGTIDHMTWGVLSLSPSDFKLMSNIHETLGFEPHSTVLQQVSSKPTVPFQGFYIDATPTPQRSMHLSLLGNPKPPPEIQEVETENSVVPIANSLNAIKLPVQKETPKKYLFPIPKESNSTTAISEEAQRNTEMLWLLLRLPERNGEYIKSWEDLTHQYKLTTQLDKMGIVPIFMDANVPADVELRRYFLRTYAYDIDLLSRSAGEPMMDIRVINPLHERTNTAGRGMTRLNMLALISELNIVVVASQSGNVCLLTLTRLNDPNGILPPILSMRVDCRLPYLCQKREFQPRCPLLGMAVSPLQKGDFGHVKGVARRWRLMLHYYDHTILSYELGRDGDDLLVS